jgi:hypothetical protein
MMRIRASLAGGSTAVVAVVALALSGCGAGVGSGAAAPQGSAASIRAAAASPRAKATSSNACSPDVTVNSFSDVDNKKTFDGVDVGNLSALAADGNTVDALSDRSELFTLNARTLRPEKVVKLGDEKGQPLDSEGMVIDRDGTRLITSEVEPSIRRYTAGGTLLGRLPVPAPLLTTPAGRAQVNLSFEGVTLQPGGNTLVASMEANLAGDASDLVRFQTWRRVGGGDTFKTAAQYGFQVSDGLGVSDIQATGDGRLIVLERGVSLAGVTVKLYLADLSGATDVSDVKDLTGQKTVRLMHQSLLADLGNCPSLGATSNLPFSNPLLDNIEGMTITGRSGADTLKLLLVSDDNESRLEKTRFYRFTVQVPRN